MNKVHYRVIFLSAIVILIFVTCKKQHTSSGNSQQTDTTKYIQPYSGTWHGSIMVLDVNPTLCYYSGDPISVTQTWKVKSDSTIVINETNIDQGSSIVVPYSWTGTIHHGDSISITSVRQINCSGVYHNITVNIKEKITTNGIKYFLNATIDYPMCPPNCLFTFGYSMTKD